MGNAIILGGGAGTAFSDDLTAKAAEVLTGKTYVGNDTNDEEGTGSMPNIAAATNTINCNGSYTIPRGYHSGSGIVKVNSLASQTVGTAAPGQILLNRTAYVNGSPVTGTMPNQVARTYTIDCDGEQAIPAGYHNGSGSVTVNSLASQTVGTAGAGDILKSQTAYVGGTKLTGTMTNQGKKTYTINCDSYQVIPAGYHDGTGSVSVNDLASQTVGTALVSTIRKGYTAYVNGTKITGTVENVAGGTYTPGTSNQTLAASGKYLTSNIVVRGDSNLVASNIRKGYTLFGIAGRYVVTPIQLVQPRDYSGSTSADSYANGFDSWTNVYNGANITGQFLTNDDGYISGQRKRWPGMYASSSHNAFDWNLAFFRSAAINLTNYNRLYYDIYGDDIHNEEIVVFGISTNSKLTTRSFTRSVTLDKNTTSAEGYLDISGVSGNYYIYFMLNPRVGSVYAYSRSVYLTT